MAYAKHDVNELGYPIDPYLKQLESRLAELVGIWGKYESEESQHQAVLEYHQVMAELYELGWDTEIDIDHYLPVELMPQYYIDKYGNPWEDYNKYNYYPNTQ